MSADQWLEFARGWELSSAAIARRLDGNYYIHERGNVAVLAHPMAHHDAGYEVSALVAAAFSAAMQHIPTIGNWKQAAVGLAGAARRALAVGGNEREEDSRPVEGLSATVLWCLPTGKVVVAGIGSCIVLACRGRVVEDVVEPQLPLPFGTQIALPDEDCLVHVRGADLSLPRDAVLVVAPPSSASRPFEVAEAAKVSLVLAELALPYRQYSPAFLAVRSNRA